MRKFDVVMLAQKLIGVVLVLLAGLTVVITDGDATAALIIAPLGFYAIFTKEKMLADNYHILREVDEEDKES